MEIVPMGDRVGLLELPREAWIVERDAGDALAGERAAHFHSGWPMGIGKHRLLQAESLQRVEHVGTELNASPDLKAFRRLFQHPHCEAFARKRMRCRQSADAAARN